MRVSLILGASVVALSLAMSNGVFAAGNKNVALTDTTATATSSKSTVTPIDPSDPNGEKACTDAGGKVSTDKDGKKVCTKSATVDTTTKTTKSGSTD